MFLSDNQPSFYTNHPSTTVRSNTNISLSFNPVKSPLLSKPSTDISSLIKPQANTSDPLISLRPSSLSPRSPVATTTAMINPPPKHKQAPIRPIITSSFKDSEDDSDFNLKAPSTRGNSATSSTHSFNSQTTEEPVIATDHLPFKVPNLRENHLRRQQALEKAQQQTNAAAFLQMKQGKFDPRNKIIIPPARIIIADFSRPHKRPNPVRKFSTVNQKENKEKKTEKKKKTSLKILNHGPMRFAAPAVPAGGATAAAKSNWKKFKQSVGLSIALKAMFSTTNKNGEKKMLGGGNPSLFAGISKSMMASRNESKAVSRIGSRVGSRIGSQVNSRVGSRVGSRKTSRSGSRAGSARKRSANVNASSVTDGPEENEVDKNIIKNSIAVVVESPTKDADIEPIKVIPEPPKVEQQALQEPKSFIKRVLMLKQKMEQEKKAQEEEEQRRLQLETQKLTAESMEIGGPISQTDESDVPKITIGLPTFTVQSASNEDLSSEQKDTNKNIPVFNIETVPDEDPTNDSNPTINIDIIEEADDTEEADSSAINANTETVSSPPISKLDKIGQSSTSLLSIFPSSPTRNSTTRSRKRSALGSGFLLSASNSGLPGRRHRPSAHKIDRTAAANLIFGNGEKKRRRRPLFFRHGFGTRSSSLAGIHEKVKNVDAVLSTERKEKIKEAEKIVELFGEYGVLVSQKVIEKGLLSPEDFLRAKQKEDEDETVGLCNIEDSKHPNMLISSDWVDLLYNTNPKDDTEKKKKKNIEIDFDFYSEQRVRYPHTMAHVNARPKSLSRINADDIRIVNTDTDEKMNRTRTYWSTEEYRKMKRDFEEKLRLQEEERKILKMSYYLKSRRMVLMRKRMESEAVDEYSSSKVLVDYTHSTKYSSKLRDTTNFAVDPGRARVDHKTGELLLPLSDSQTKNQQINQPPTKYHPLNSLSTTPLPEISSHQRKRSQTSSLFDNKADRKVLHVPWRRATSAFYTKGGNGNDRVISRPRTTVGETVFHEKFADHRRSVSESRDKGTVYVQGSYERYKPGILI